jgi:hypothetical protein
LRDNPREEETHLGNLNWIKMARPVSAVILSQLSFIIIRTIKSRRMRCAGNVARTGEKTNACRVLVGTSEGKRPPRGPRRRWEDNIKMDRRETGWDGVVWIHLAQNIDQWRRALVNTVMSLRVP